MKRAGNKATIIRIEPRYQVLNSSCENIEIEVGEDRLRGIGPGDLMYLYKEEIHEGNLVLLFGKYHRKVIDLSHKGVNYLEMEELYFKVSVATLPLSLAR